MGWTLVKPLGWFLLSKEIAMGPGNAMIVLLPALDEVYKLLAVAVALYFPLAVLAWLAIDKLHKASDKSPTAPQGRAREVHGQFAFNRNPQRNS